jgi:hypothetical protein
MPTLVDPNTFTTSGDPADGAPSDGRAASNEEVQAIDLAKKPLATKQGSPTLLIIASLAAFVLFDRKTETWQQLAMLVGVLFFHEAGHIAGMRWFGYRDLRMLFIPFFGALASGRKSDAPSWQRAVVLLLGPLPGLVLSMLLLAAHAKGIGHALAVQLLLINALNLFPLVPLDGGLFVQQLFTAHPRVQGAWSAIGLLAFGALCLFGKSWFLAGVAAFLLLLVPTQVRIAVAADALRRAWGPVPPITELSDAASRDLYRRARDTMKTPSPRPEHVASVMRQMRERASSEPVSASAAFGLVFAYAAGFGLIVVDLVLFAVRR